MLVVVWGAGGGLRQMHVNLSNGVTFQRLLSLDVPCKDGVNEFVSSAFHG